MKTAAAVATAADSWNSIFKTTAQLPHGSLPDYPRLA
jgi:hypothetical protein